VVWTLLGSGRVPWPAAVSSRSLSRSTDGRPRDSQSTQSRLLRAEPIPLTASAPAAAPTMEARP
jgi:hypothetical protein